MAILTDEELELEIDTVLNKMLVKGEIPIDMHDWQISNITERMLELFKKLLTE